MSRLRQLLVLGLVLAAVVPGEVRAEDAPAASGHRLGVYMGAGVLLHMSSARTQGGIGGGIGLRDTVDERFILQADLNHLLMFGSVVGLRLGAGVQRRGVYQPAALVTLTTLLGSQVSFMTPEHLSPVRHPAVTLGVSLAPLRFSSGRTQVSLLEVGLGVGPELPGLGLSYRLGLLEVGLAL